MDQSNLADAILSRVVNALDALAQIGQQYEGLIPSIIDRQKRSMLDGLPPDTDWRQKTGSIPGQRNGDRSPDGCNLMHDLPLLHTMLAMGQLKRDLPAAAERYLHRFTTHCTSTATGLFPWGEHAYWNLRHDQPGNAYAPRLNDPLTHDHLRQAPVWFWQYVQRFNPAAVQQFADGLDYHFEPPGPQRQYMRHAPLDRLEHYHPDPDGRSFDFPRHSGFYILDLAFAQAQHPRPKTLNLLTEFADYWWQRRQPNGLCLIESRTPPHQTEWHRVLSPPQTFSLGLSLLDAAELLDAQHPELATTLRQRADVYLHAALDAGHQPEADYYLVAMPMDRPHEARPLAIWGSVYGSSPAAAWGVLCLDAYRKTADRRFLDFAISIAQSYLRAVMPTDRPFPAKDAGRLLELLAGLYELTAEHHWLAQGLQLTSRLLPLFFDDSPIPRSAAGYAYYDSQMCPGYLLHGLARIGLLAGGCQPMPLAADFTDR